MRLVHQAMLVALLLTGCSTGNPESVKLPKHARQDPHVLIVRDPVAPDSRSNLGSCWPNARAGQICAQGLCSCGKDSRAPVWVCNPDRQCGFLRYERCESSDC
jgi:hypothetical protein